MKQKSGSQSQTASSAKATATDPVCGMEVEKESALQADVEGETYYFCSEDCREQFLSEPSDAESDQ